MSRAPRFSVLVPAFQAERFVAETVRSVGTQTCDDWEVVAVDDASRDGTASVLEDCASRDSRIRVFRNPANLGMTANWNRCLREARGEFVLKLDADDVLRPKALETLGEALRRPDVVGAAVRALLCDATGEVYGAPPGDAALQAAGVNPYADVDLPSKRWLEIAAFGHQLWSSSAFAAPREWLLSTGGWNECFGCASDTELLLRLLRSGGTFAHRAYVGLQYRNVPGSVSDVFRREGWLAWEAVVVYLLTLSESKDLLASSRRARQRRVVLWRRWLGRSQDRLWSERMPAEMKARLEAAMRGQLDPPLIDRLLESLVALAGRLAGNRG